MNAEHPAFKDYGGRGVTFHDGWVDSPDGFLAWRDHISSLPGFGEPGLTLDRVNNDRGYEPGNLRWATKEEQANNRRRELLLAPLRDRAWLAREYVQLRRSEESIASELGCRYVTIRYWLDRHDLPIRFRRSRGKVSGEVLALRCAARKAVLHAVLRGDLAPEACLFCGVADAQAHHHDYTQPLAVTWLCARHHALVHRLPPSRVAP